MPQNVLDKKVKKRIVPRSRRSTGRKRLSHKVLPLPWVESAMAIKLKRKVVTPAEGQQGWRIDNHGIQTQFVWPVSPTRPEA